MYLETLKKMAHETRIVYLGSCYSKVEQSSICKFIISSYLLIHYDGWDPGVVVIWEIHDREVVSLSPATDN